MRGNIPEGPFNKEIDMKVQSLLFLVVVSLFEIAWSEGEKCDEVKSSEKSPAESREVAAEWHPGTPVKLAPEDERELSYGPSVFEDLRREPTSLYPVHKPMEKPVLLKTDKFRD